LKQSKISNRRIVQRLRSVKVVDVDVAIVTLVKEVPCYSLRSYYSCVFEPRTLYSRYAQYAVTSIHWWLSPLTRPDKNSSYIHVTSVFWNSFVQLHFHCAAYSRECQCVHRQSSPTMQTVCR